MNKKTGRITQAFMVASVLLAGTMLSAPASAQTSPVSQYCSKQLPGDAGTWKNVAQTFSCVTVETQTIVTSVWACVPSPACTPGLAFLTRSRRTHVPNILLARSAGIPAIGLPTCVLTPTTTEWTPWTLCSRGSPPARLRLDGIWGGFSPFP